MPKILTVTLISLQLYWLFLAQRKDILCLYNKQQILRVRSALVLMCLKWPVLWLQRRWLWSPRRWALQSSWSWYLMTAPPPTSCLTCWCVPRDTFWLDLFEKTETSVGPLDCCVLMKRCNGMIWGSEIWSKALTTISLLWPAVSGQLYSDFASWWHKYLAKFWLFSSYTKCQDMYLLFYFVWKSTVEYAEYTTTGHTEQTCQKRPDRTESTL